MNNFPKVNWLQVLFLLVLCLPGNLNAQKSMHTIKNKKGNSRDFEKKIYYHNGRTDSRLTATFGSCFQDQYRHFTLLDGSRWDAVRWTVEGNLYAGCRLFLDAEKTEWPGGEPNYSRRMELTVNGEKVDHSSMSIHEVEHQFDFRKVGGESGDLGFERIDMIISSLQWISGFNLHNESKQEKEIALELSWKSSVSVDDSSSWTPRYIDDPTKKLILGTIRKDGFFMTDATGLTTFIKTDKPFRVFEEEGMITAVWNISIPARDKNSLSVVTRAGYGPLVPAEMDPAITEVNNPGGFVHNVTPAIPCDSRFRHCVYSYGRTPLTYQFKITKPGKYTVAIGLVDTSNTDTEGRILDIYAEGKKVQTVDLIKEYGENMPGVVAFDVDDDDEDGIIPLSLQGKKNSYNGEAVYSFIDIFHAANAPSAGQILTGDTEIRAVASVNANRKGEAFQRVFINSYIPEKLMPERIITYQETELNAMLRMLGIEISGISWNDLMMLCKAKRDALYGKMPRLEGVDESWEGAWSYVFDILRAGTLPGQGQCKDVWMVADLLFYRWTFYWDTGNHTYANWDADVAARTILTFLKGMKEDGALPIHFNPDQFMQSQPQLMNLPITLWESYLISRDRSLLEEAYPLLVRHQTWLNKEINKTPDGPLADIGNNIDYGTPLLHKYKTIWVDMNMFQLNQYRMIAKMARELGKSSEEIANWENKADKLQEGIQKYMWNEELGTYNCVEANTYQPIPTGSPIEFYGMTVGVATREQARRLVKRVTDPEKYAAGGKYPYAIPSAPYDDPSFVVRDGWGGTIWLIQPYYTVRGLSDYGFQDEAADIANNLYGMVAKEYTRSGTIWEQYRPDNGQGIHLGYFTSSITVNVSDMLLRGWLGFSRQDIPYSFMLNPRPVGNNWQGITNLSLGGECSLDIHVKNDREDVMCKLSFHNLPQNIHIVEILMENMQGSQKIENIRINNGKVNFSLPKHKETSFRFLLKP